MREQSGCQVKFIIEMKTAGGSLSAGQDTNTTANMRKRADREMQATVGRPPNRNSGEELKLVNRMPSKA